MMRVVTSLMLLITMLAGLQACETLPTSSHGDDHPSIQMVDSVREQIEQAEEIGQSSSLIDSHLQDIDREAEEILWRTAEIPDEEMTSQTTEVEARATSIRDSVKDAHKEQVRIEEALEDLGAANARAAAAIGQVEGLEELVAEYKQSDREIRQQAIKNMRGFVSLAFSIGFIMLVGGAFLALKIDAKLGSAIMGVGVLAVGFGAASQYYLEEIAIVGLVALVVGFILVMFLLGNTLVKGKGYQEATREIVELIEEIKDHMSESNLDGMRKEIFGPNGFASRFQNDITKKIVAEVKAKNHFERLSRLNK